MTQSRQPARLRPACPDCGGQLAVRTSREEGAYARYMVLACDDVEHCGSTWSSQLELTARISPGANPNPGVQLRTVAPRARRAANDDHHAAAGAAAAFSGLEVPPIANDDHQLGEATG